MKKGEPVDRILAMGLFATPTDDGYKALKEANVGPIQVGKEVCYLLPPSSDMLLNAANCSETEAKANALLKIRTIRGIKMAVLLQKPRRHIKVGEEITFFYSKEFSAELSDWVVAPNKDTAGNAMLEWKRVGPWYECPTCQKLFLKNSCDWHVRLDPNGAGKCCT
jgi:hypothetical protein